MKAMWSASLLVLGAAFAAALAAWLQPANVLSFMFLLSFCQ